MHGTAWHKYAHSNFHTCDTSVPSGELASLAKSGNFIVQKLECRSDME